MDHGVADLGPEGDGLDGVSEACHIAVDGDKHNETIVLKSGHLDVGVKCRWRRFGPPANERGL
jgi:hypothetical protein